MSAPAVERLLAGLYSDRALLREFLAAPLATAGRLGLSGEEAEALAAIDPAEFEFAARRYDEVRAFFRTLPAARRGARRKRR